MAGIYNLDSRNIVKEFDSNSERGLRHAEANERLEKYGPNKLKESHKISKLQIFLSQFKSFIVLILIAATIISFLIGEVIDASVIFLIVILNGVFGYLQEYNAEKSIEALKKLTSLKSRVIRDGKEMEIDSSELVPGDVLLLEEGSKIPADGRIIDCNNFEANEASLTGESFPVSKFKESIEGKKILADQKNMVFSSTIVTKGNAKVIVTGTGMNTEVGKIAKLLDENKEDKTPLQKGLDKLGKRLGILTILICIVIFLMEFYAFYDGSNFIFALNEAFMISIALAVAAIPEGLPAVVTISLALGVKAMVKKNALIRHMTSVETLGSTNIICTDKTGTLTKNEMTVKKIFCSNEVIDVVGEGYDPEGKFVYDNKKVKKSDVELLLKTGILCNNSNLNKENDKWKIIGDPTEACLLVSSVKFGLNIDDEKDRNKRIHEIPFSSESKMMVTINEFGKTKTAYIKGAPEIILKKCSKILINGKIHTMTDSYKKQVLEMNDLFTSDALRVLGFAYKPLTTKYDDRDLIFIGLQGMIDPPRREVKKSISLCHNAGIRVVMITGDNINTAKAIASELGIRGKAISGEELNRLSDEKLSSIINKVAIFARVNPEHKIKIVDMLQDKGNVVAMTGDGVNDAPALKSADVGVAMGITGTDVSKEASDIILTDDNFTSIVNAVEHGRGIYDNIRRFINYLLSSNFAEILIILFASLLGMPLPLTAIHLLWLNLVTDGLPAIALGVDEAGKDVMEKKPRSPKENIINKQMTYSIISLGLIISIATLVLFNFNLDNVIKGQTIAFTSLFVFEIVRLYSIRQSYGLSLFSNKYLIYAVVSSAVLQLLVIYTPLSKFFGTVALSALDWGYIVSMALVLLVVSSGLNLIISKVKETY